MGILTTFGTQNGIYWPHYWHFLLIMYGAYLSISCMTIKTCLHEKFQFFNIFCKRFSQKWAFWPFLGHKMGIYWPHYWHSLLIMYGAYLSISCMTIKTCLHEKFQFFNVFCKRFSQKWAFWPLLGHKMGIYWPHYWHFLLIMYGAYLSISCMTIKTCLHEKFQFFNIFCKRFSKKWAFWPFLGHKMGIYWPHYWHSLLIMYGAYLSISCMTIKTCLHEKFQFFNVFCKRFSQKWAFWPLLGHKMGIYWPHYWHFLLIMYGAYLSISCMTIKTCLHEKFQFFNIFCKRFSQKWAFWPLLGHKMGIYWPHYWHFLLIMYGAY